MSAYKRKDRKGEYWFRFRFKQGSKVTRYNPYGGKTRAQASLAERELITALENAKPADPETDLNGFILTHYWPSQQNHLTPAAMGRSGYSQQTP